MTTTPKPKDETRTATAYHVLLQINAEGARPTYQVVAQNVQAANADKAIRVYADKAGDDAAGTYVAIPSRSWKKPTVVGSETKTILTFT